MNVKPPSSCVFLWFGNVVLTPCFRSFLDPESLCHTTSRFLGFRPHQELISPTLLAPLPVSIPLLTTFHSCHFLPWSYHTASLLTCCHSCYYFPGITLHILPWCLHTSVSPLPPTEQPLLFNPPIPTAHKGLSSQSHGFSSSHVWT